MCNKIFLYLGDGIFNFRNLEVLELVLWCSESELIYELVLKRVSSQTINILRVPNLQSNLSKSPNLLIHSEVKNVLFLGSISSRSYAQTPAYSLDVSNFINTFLTLSLMHLRCIQIKVDWKKKNTVLGSLSCWNL